MMHPARSIDAAYSLVVQGSAAEQLRGLPQRIHDELTARLQALAALLVASASPLNDRTRIHYEGYVATAELDVGARAVRVVRVARAGDRG